MVAARARSGRPSVTTWQFQGDEAAAIQLPPRSSGNSNSSASRLVPARSARVVDKTDRPREGKQETLQGRIRKGAPAFSQVLGPNRLDEVGHRNRVDSEATGTADKNT